VPYLPSRKMKILGISAFYHDSAAALVVDGQVLAAVQQERFSRVKHDARFPAEAIKYCLEYTGLSISDLDAIVFYDKPWLKFERLLESYYGTAPRGLPSFLTSLPVWLSEKLFQKSELKKNLQQIGKVDFKKTPLLFTEHHQAHAASAFYPSPFSTAAILTVDGVGEWATASISHGNGNAISVLRELHYPHSLGLLYSAFTYYLGFKVNSGEYKVMGLAPYGNANSSQTKLFREAILSDLVDVKADGSLHLNLSNFEFTTGLRMVNPEKMERLLGLAIRKPETPLQQSHADLALALQQVTEHILLKMADEAQRLTGEENLCLAGGVALNCVANGKLLRMGNWKNIYIQPAAGDAGGALGAALAGEYLLSNRTREIGVGYDGMQGSYLGPEYSDLDVERMIRHYQAKAEKQPDTVSLCRRVAGLLAEGKIVGWHQGRMEWGPRALGNRSILGDPRRADMQQRMNLAIKFREGFRPFAPAILAEHAEAYFGLKVSSPYMLLVAELNPAFRLDLPENFEAMSFAERLATPRSTLPAITHLDYSARVQTVHLGTNPLFHALLTEFFAQTGCPVLVNTSFNVRGEPFVNTPKEAYAGFMRTNMDALAIGSYLFFRGDQPIWPEAPLDATLFHGVD
jgi:carbamoyltransferase